MDAVKAENEERSEDDNETRGGNENILIVDDEESLLEILETILKKAGYTTILAGNGEEAVEIYKKECNRIDLVILDLSMPEMGGDKCHEKLKEINPGVKIIISSGYSHEIQHKKIYIDKPADGSMK